MPITTHSFIVCEKKDNRRQRLRSTFVVYPTWEQMTFFFCECQGIFWGWEGGMIFYCILFVFVFCFVLFLGFVLGCVYLLILIIKFNDILISDVHLQFSKYYFDFKGMFILWKVILVKFQTSRTYGYLKRPISLRQTEDIRGLEKCVTIYI